MVQGGRDLGDSLVGLPLVGAQARDVARKVFAGAGGPLSDFGTQLEQFIFVVAIVLALLLAIVTLAPWLYPLSPVAMGAIAARPGRPPGDPDGARPGRRLVARALAMRAFSRLDYATLLEYTPDPLGDWTNGRHDRLARAELASVGLRVGTLDPVPGPAP